MNRDYLPPEVSPFAELQRVIERDFAPSRERSLALTNLEQAGMWLDKALPKEGVSE